MKIYLLLNQAYPNGYALTKRFHLYAKGFIENDHLAKIIIPMPTETDDSENKLTSGKYDKVPFEYTWKSTVRSKSFLIRRIHDFTGAINTARILLKDKPDILITSSFSTFFHFFLKFVSLTFPLIIIKEKNEIDFLRKDTVGKTDLRKLKITSQLFHGYIVINELLLTYLNHDLKDRKPKVIVPILVDDFTGNQQLEIQKTIVYTGTYLERKDGILSILKAFSKIKEKYPEYKLILTGSPAKSEDLPKITQIITTYNLDSSIVFTGFLKEAELQKILLSAGILIIAKPENRQNLYNFPTKIGEYLVSGRPVISTKVGVVGKLLQNGNNIIFAEYDVDDIVQKIEFLIVNPNLGNQIGQKGREFALKNFNYKYHAKKMINFFNELKHQ